MACVGSVEACVQLNDGGGGGQNVKMIHSTSVRAAGRTENIEDCGGLMCEYVQPLQVVLSRGSPSKEVT